MEHPQKSVELFHLLFLRQLGEKLESNLYAVKGGCNLRFFFKSLRYSEDLDLDVKTVAKETLRKKVSKILESQNFRQILSMRGIGIDSFTEAKQTDTTQRWKLSLKLLDIPMPLPTKIEFSRRGMEEGIKLEFIDSEVIQRHQLYPILTTHYTQEAAFCQKVDALIHRTEVQARDIFDLQWLLNRGLKIQLPKPLFEKLDVAIENALTVDFAEFKARVVAYLMEEYQEYYNSPAVWNEIQAKVISALEGMKAQ